MNTAAAIKLLDDVRDSKTIRHAVNLIERRPGIYSIFIDNANNLPEKFCSRLKHDRTRLLYVGRATDSLFKRLIEQELRHKGKATFFRGLGAVLGYRPAFGSLHGKVNQNNYSFNAKDTAQITSWIERHLRVHWIYLPAKKVLEIESGVIRHLSPLFNYTNNHNYFEELLALRRECRKIARLPRINES